RAIGRACSKPQIAQRQGASGSITASSTARGSIVASREEGHASSGSPGARRDGRGSGGRGGARARGRRGLQRGLLRRLGAARPREARSPAQPRGGREGGAAGDRRAVP